jgi:beta-glucosidase
MARFGELGLRPIVDLLHYGTPLWLEREFAHPDYPQHVAEYATRVAARYAEQVTDYTPVNEPMIHALFSGEYAYWPPYLSGQDGLVRMVERLSRGFALTQAGIRDVLGDRATFVHVDAGFRYVGDVGAPEHREHARQLHAQTHLVEDLVTGRVDAGHELAGFLSAHGMTDDDLSWFAAHPVLPDVMGVNYYPRHSTEVFEAGVRHGGGFADPRPTRDDGVEGLEEVLRRAAERYAVPVMLTETCVTGTVAERLEWLDASVATMHRMRAAGVDLVGYTWWPVFDMYEWTFRHSTDPREAHRLPMGLWELVERDADGAGDLDRIPTPLVARFRAHATDPGVPKR